MSASVDSKKPKFPFSFYLYLSSSLVPPSLSLSLSLSASLPLSQPLSPSLSLSLKKQGNGILNQKTLVFPSQLSLSLSLSFTFLFKKEDNNISVCIFNAQVRELNSASQKWWFQWQWDSTALNLWRESLEGTAILLYHLTLNCRC